MKNFVTLILLSLVSLGIYSCSKDSGSPVTYTVSGLTDVSLAQGESDVLTLTISNASSYQEQVSLDVEGVPTGVSVSFSAKSGTPAFTTNITLSNNSAAIGTYNCTLGVKGTQTGTRYYKFTLIITATAACGLPGPYAYTQTCNANTGTENLISFSTNGSVRFANFGAQGWTVFAYVNCGTGVMEVPLQSVGNNTQVSGTGTFNVDGTVNMNYTVVNTITNIETECAFTMLSSN